MAWRGNHTNSYSTFSDTASFVSSNSETDPLSSPSDGYFSNRSHPQEMFIDTDAANKGASSKLPRASPGSMETTPMRESFLGQDAPPTYLEATTPGLNQWQSRPSGDEGARLLPFQGGPSSMAMADPAEGAYKGWTYKRKSFREHCSRKRMLKWMAALIAIVILAAIFAAATHQESKNKTVIVAPTPTESALPGTQPGTPSEPEKEYPIRWPSYCGKDYNVRSDRFYFGSTPELSIKEGVMDGPYKHVRGWIHVVPAPPTQEQGTIQAKLSFAASSWVNLDWIQYSSSATGLMIGDPSFAGLLKGLQHGPACLGMSVMVFVAPGVKLENFDVESLHLGMQLHDGVDLTVSNETTISLTTGTLDALPFNSRQTRLKTVSGSISGKYPLNDLLTVDTVSGSVNINVEPREKAEGGSETAIFQVKSVSGSIRTDFERKRIPTRDYQTYITTNVGSVDGTYIHGSNTSIESVAGHITADILPFTSNSASALSTLSRSGQMSITLRAPYMASGTVMSNLATTHKSISGAIDLTYPQEWEGHLDGTSLSGALHLQGKDLELIDETNEPGRNHVEAKKGKGGSSLVFSTISGECDIKVGKL